MDYARIKKYFATGSGNSAGAYLGFGAVFLVLGFFLFVFGCSDEELLPILGIGLMVLALGIGFLIWGIMLKNAMTDEELDKVLTDYFAMQNLKKRALNKLGLDESEVMEIAPVYFDGYHFEGVPQIKVGKDNKARSSQGRAVYFFFTQNEVHCYTHTVSLVENFYSEDTDTYFYSDIVSVSTVTSTGTTLIPGKPQQRMYQYDSFKLTTTGGTSIQASLRDKAGTERSINGMRNLIKAKKQAQ